MQVSAVIDMFLYWWPGGREDGPEDPEHFGVHAQVLIGGTDGPGADSFDVWVCSPTWLAAEFQAGRHAFLRTNLLTGMDESIYPGSGLWLMGRWDQQAFEADVRTLCGLSSPGPDWGTVADRIGRLIPWEFDYKYDDHVNQRYGEPYPRPRGARGQTPG